jgi:hypothetical protein
MRIGRFSSGDLLLLDTPCHVPRDRGGGGVLDEKTLEEDPPPVVPHCIELWITF